jgi:pimeloyl-ACP methyl ester carboxylesterase
VKYFKFSTLPVVILATLLFSIDSQAQTATEQKMYEVKVLLSRYDIAVDIHRPEYTGNKPVLLLVHGATYGKWLWDVPGASWKEYLCEELGYTVVAVDLPGYGESSHPNGDMLTPLNNALIMAKVVMQLRREIDSDIIWVGHSFGGLTGNLIAENFEGLLDGLVNIGWVHCDMLLTLQNLPAQNLSIMLAGNYISMPTETRINSFYYAPGVEQSVVDYDIDHAFPMPRGNMFYALQSDKYALNNIKIPVFLSAGDRDAMLNNYSLEEEALLFSGSPAVGTYLQTDSAHVSPLHINYRDLIDRIDSWVIQNF